METLDKTALEKIGSDLSTTFDEVQSKIRAIEQEEQRLLKRKSQLNVELFRLQGEHRLLRKLQGEDQPVDSSEEKEEVTPQE